MFIGFAGNRDPDAPSAQVGSNGPSAIGLVPTRSVRTLLGASRSVTADGSARHHVFERLRLVDLTRREHKCHGLARPFGADVHFRAKTALAGA